MRKEIPARTDISCDRCGTAIVCNCKSMVILLSSPDCGDQWRKFDLCGKCRDFIALDIHKTFITPLGARTKEKFY